MSLLVGEVGVQTSEERELALSGLTREPQLTASRHVHRLSTYLHYTKSTIPD